MAAEDGNNEEWRGDTEGHCSTFIASLLHESARQKAGGPGNTKVHGFCHCAYVLNSQ